MYAPCMNSFSSVINRLGGAAAVAKFVGEQPGTIQQMKSRESVRPKYWPGLIAMARKKKIAGVTHAALAQIAADQQRAA